MSLLQVNLLNIALMLVSLGVACILPFELFLFSYAVLGPLHYLTEISWLHDRSYFVPQRSLAWPIFGLTVLVTLTSPMIVELGDGAFATMLSSWGPEYRFGALALAGVFVASRTARSRRVGVVLACGVVVAAHFVNEAWKAKAGEGAGLGAYDLFFMLFLTTIVHVWVFTGAFVILGSLRGRSLSGYASLVVFLGCSVACFVVPVVEIPSVSESVRDAYDASATMLNLFMARLVDPSAVRDVSVVYDSSLGTMTARLIAYAYTYHYLNWFSKTSVIQWHDVSPARLVVVVVVWLVSLGVYAWDYLVGLNLLFFLSMLHVFLEFPLNWRSFADIGGELRARWSPVRD